MNKIVREHYPVEKLPEDLREGLEPGATVRVVLEVDGEAEAARRQLDAWSENFWSQKPAEREALSRDALLEQLRVLRASNPAPVSQEEAVAEIRALRDEWDD
ncbi:hypothetical protein [Affinirhizobium pseudoryzae]|uniref:hypothetical protein n=1 Tax=Allorhizobium pseudoryzae TaxID=379684 RepID=UPI0013EB2A79|nr:hypothetical protein [Allorhizobium pseudoryzae]